MAGTPFKMKGSPYKQGKSKTKMLKGTTIFGKTIPEIKSYVTKAMKKTVTDVIKAHDPRNIYNIAKDIKQKLSKKTGQK